MKSIMINDFEAERIDELCKKYKGNIEPCDILESVFEAVGNGDFDLEDYICDMSGLIREDFEED